jgi:hypothetical protein
VKSLREERGGCPEKYEKEREEEGPKGEERVFGGEKKNV